MTRKLTGAVVGIVLAMLVVALVQTVGHYLFPEPELPANPSPQQLRDAVAAARRAGPDVEKVVWAETIAFPR